MARSKRNWTAEEKEEYFKKINEKKARKELIVESTDSIETEDTQNEVVNNECDKGKIEKTYAVSSMKRITLFTHYTDIYIYSFTAFVYCHSTHIGGKKKQNC